MAISFHFIETEIRYLLPEEGGRKTGVWSGYRGQFNYNGNDHDGFQFFPDSHKQMIQLGTNVRALVRFLQVWWDEVHADRIDVGMPFEIREGEKTVGQGKVTNLDAHIEGLRMLTDLSPAT